MTEPVSLADIKQHLVLDPDDTSEDSYLTSLLLAARAGCEEFTRRSVVGEPRTLVLDAFPRSFAPLTWPIVPALPEAADITLPGGTITDVVVNYIDGDGISQILDEQAYHASLNGIPAVLRPVSEWPGTQARPGAVTIAYTTFALAGGKLEMARQAIRLMVGHWYANREAVVTDGRGGMTEVPLAVTWLLKPLQIWASS